MEELDKRNKLFSDYETLTAAAIRRELAGTGDELERSTQRQLDRSSYLRAAWVLAFGLLAIVLNAYRTRLNRELEEERAVTRILQRAFRSESTPLPHCDVGSAYLSASSDHAVGGDVFDVYRLSENRALILIADISGKGVDAAVLTAFIKFMVRAIALRNSDPMAILTEFNVVLSKAVGDPYIFVSMFVGLLDTDTFAFDVCERRTRYRFRAPSQRRRPACDNRTGPGRHGRAVRVRNDLLAARRYARAWRPTV